MLTHYLNVHRPVSSVLCGTYSVSFHFYISTNTQRPVSENNCLHDVGSNLKCLSVAIRFSMVWYLALSLSINPNRSHCTVRAP